MNFQDLDEIIQSRAEKIVLDSDVVLDESDHLIYPTGIMLDANGITIDGAGHTINAGGFNAFKVTGDSITLENITFKNAAIFTHADVRLSISRCSFEGSGNSGYSGGMIYNGGGDIALIDCSFKNADLSDDGSSGGAISNHGKMTLKGCEFFKNSAPAGGAILNTNKMALTDCAFKSNTASIGGAILNRSRLRIYDSSFKANRNPIYNTGEICVCKTHFEANTESAISNLNEAKITDSSFIANSASSGAAINNSINDSQGDISIDKCIFAKNEADHGGAISNSYVARIKECDFDSNASKLGGAIYSSTPYANYLGVADCTFSSNRADEKGGAIIVHGDLEAKDSSFKNNSSEKGGAIYNSHKERFKLENCSYNGNTPDDVLCNYDHC